MTKKSKYPHCVLVWNTDTDGVLIDMRLLTPKEFQIGKYGSYSWGAYQPDGVKAPPSDLMTTNRVNKYGLEAIIFEHISNGCKSVAHGVLNRLQVDLRRFRINGWDLDPERGYWGREHREMIESASYVEAS